MSDSKMREEFEVWAEQMGWNIEKRRSLQGDSYVYPSAMDAWMAWQASREALVIALPRDVTQRTSTEVRDMIKHHIEAQGLKVKS